MSTGAIVAIVIVVLALPGIVGVLAVLGIYGTRKYIANAKTAEARVALGVIAKSAVAAYETEALNAPVLSQGAATSIVRKLCPSAHAIPASVSAVAAKKYQSQAAEWRGDPGWACLKFEMPAPQYYQYNYTSTAGTFRAVATGDLNGDGTVSTFELRGKVESDRVVVAPQISETDPEE